MVDQAVEAVMQALEVVVTHQALHPLRVMTVARAMRVAMQEAAAVVVALTRLGETAPTVTVVLVALARLLP